MTEKPTSVLDILKTRHLEKTFSENNWNNNNSLPVRVQKQIEIKNNFIGKKLRAIRQGFQEKYKP